MGDLVGWDLPDRRMARQRGAQAAAAAAGVALPEIIRQAGRIYANGRNIWTGARRVYESISGGPDDVEEPPLRRARNGEGGGPPPAGTIGAPDRSAMAQMRYRMKCCLQHKLRDSGIFQLQPFTGNPLITLLNGVPTGTDWSNRIGRKITMLSIHVRGIFRATSTLANDQLARAILIYDAQTNQVTPSGADIFQTVADDAYSYMNLANRDRFRVIAEFTQVIQPKVTAGVVVASQSYNYEWYRKLNLSVLYDNTGSLVGDVITGGLFMVSVCGGGAVDFVHQFSARLRFVDA